MWELKHPSNGIHSSYYSPESRLKTVLPIKAISLQKQTGRITHLGKWVLSYLQMRYGCAELKVPGGTLAMLQVSTVCWLQCMRGLNSAQTAGTGEHDAALHNDGPQSFLVDTLIDKQRYFRTGFSAEPDQKWIIHKPFWAGHLFYPSCMIPTGVGVQAQMMCQSTNNGCKNANQRS